MQIMNLIILVDIVAIVNSIVDAEILNHGTRQTCSFSNLTSNNTVFFFYAQAMALIFQYMNKIHPGRILSF